MIYEGTIRHRRFAQRRHEFTHRVAMAYEEVPSAPLVELDGPVRRLSFGRGFNPVRFYYCFDADEHLRALVAEVTNTPWGERHSYVLQGSGPVLHGEHDKAMRVSPFMGMDQRYVWHAAAPGETLSVHIESVEQGRKAFDATLRLERGGTGRATSSLRVRALIYAHALMLGAKGVRR